MDWKQWLGGLLFLPLIFALRGALGYGSSYCLAWSGQRITNDVKTDAFRKISAQSLDFFQKTTTAGAESAASRWTASRLNNFLRMGLNDLVKEPSTIVSCLAAMLIINWKFTLLALFYVPFCILPARTVSKKIKELGRKDFETGVGQGSVTLESFQNVRITKAYALEEVHAAQYRKNADRSTYYNMKSIQSREMLNPIVQTLSALAISLVLLYAMWSNCDSTTLFMVHRRALPVRRVGQEAQCHRHVLHAAQPRAGPPDEPLRASAEREGSAGCEADGGLHARHPALQSRLQLWRCAGAAGDQYLACSRAAAGPGRRKR